MTDSRSHRRTGKPIPENPNTLYETAVQLSEDEEAVADWFPFNINEDEGLLSKLL